MNQKKIVYLKFTPLTKKVYADCCMESLISSGYTIEYWEISKLVGANYSNFERYKPDNQLVLREVNSFAEFEDLVSQNGDILYFTLMSLNAKHIHFLRILAKQKCTLAFWGPFPTPYQKRTAVEKIKNTSLKSIKSKLGQELVKFCFKIGYIHPINYMFSAGNKGCLELCLGFHIQDLLRTIEMCPINSSDYNNYEYNIQNRIIENDYIVFLDEYYPFHPDDSLWGTKSYPSDLYYNSLNKTLDLIENHFGLEIVVAAHPKALLYKEENYFKGRKVLFNATGSLVKYAKMAITHDSTSMSFAVMNKIPIIQLTSDWLEQNRQDLVHSIESFSNRLSLPILNMDKVNEELVNNLSLQLNKEQQEHYDGFIYDYCTSSPIRSSNEDLVVNYINSIFETC